MNSTEHHAASLPDLRDDDDEDSVIIQFYHHNHLSLPRVVPPLAVSDSINIWARSHGYGGKKIRINTIARVLRFFGVTYASTTDKNGFVSPAFFLSNTSNEKQSHDDQQDNDDHGSDKVDTFNEHIDVPAPPKSSSHANNKQEEDYAVQWLRAFLSQKTENVQDSFVEYSDFKSAFKKFMTSCQAGHSKLPRDLNAVLEPSGFLETRKYLCKHCRRRHFRNCCSQFSCRDRLYSHVILHMRLL